MANMQVTVVDGNNITVTLDRGVAGVGISSVELVTIDSANYLLITYTNGTTDTVGPVGIIQYNAVSPITITGAEIGLDTVPVAKGGTGQITANAGFNALAPAQATHAGKYLKTDGTNAAWDQLDISTADITGTLPIVNGGTGQTTANTGLNALLPAQTGQANKYLQTDGTNSSWDAISLSTADITGTLPVLNGGTGVTTSTGTGSVVLSTSPALTTPTGIVKNDVGLGNVDNTSDADKPVSTAQATAIGLKVTANAGITGATHTKITYDSKGLVTAGTDATTADIADSTNKRYVTDAQILAFHGVNDVNTSSASAAQGVKADSALQPGAIGVTVQAYDADLTTWAGITPGTGVATALANTAGAANGVATYNQLGTAAFTAASTYVPYSGATGAVDLNGQHLVNTDHIGVGTSVSPNIPVRVVTNNDSLSRIAIRGYSSDANSSSMRVSKFRGTVGAPQVPQNADSLGKFEVAGYATTSADALPGASLEGVATETWGATAHGTKLLVKVTPNTTTTQATAITIDQDKSVTFAGTVSATNLSGTNTGDQTNISGNAATASAVAVGGITGLGTGVATALAVNVGSAGAPVVNGGALGTPSSGSLANCTAYPGTSALVTVGALNSGSITSGFGSIDVGTDPISGGAGNFTTLRATGTLTIPTGVWAKQGVNNFVYSDGTHSLISAGSADLSVRNQADSANYATFSSTGLTVTGALSASGTLGTIATDASGSTLTFSRNSANYITATGAASNLLFGAGGVNGQMTLDASGNLGLGVTPSAWLSTRKALQLNSSGVSIAGVSVAQIMELRSNSYINSSAQEIYLTSNTAAIYQINAGTHTWYTAPSGTAGNPITFTQSLAVGKGTTLALEGATSGTGTGISFPATQNASSDANTLDDYEEGTWTPGYGTWSSAPTTAAATYTKIGRQVTVNIIGQNGTAAAGSTITGLPFASSGTAGGDGIGRSIETSSVGFTGLVWLATTSISAVSAVTFGTDHWSLTATYFV